MHRLFLAILALGLSHYAQATTSYLTFSQIEDHQLWDGFDQLESEVIDPLLLWGITYYGGNDNYSSTQNMFFEGQLQFKLDGQTIRATFDLSGGTYIKDKGLSFSNGQILFETQQSGTQEYRYLSSTVASSEQPKTFFQTMGGGYIQGFQNSAGLMLPNSDPQQHLPGLWEGLLGGSGFNNGVGYLEVLDKPIWLYLSGTMELYIDQPEEEYCYSTGFPKCGPYDPWEDDPSEIPLPASIGLFATALGLLSTRRINHR